MDGAFGSADETARPPLPEPVAEDAGGYELGVGYAFGDGYPAYIGRSGRVFVFETPSGLRYATTETPKRHQREPE